VRKKWLGSSGKEISDKIPLEVATNILRVSQVAGKRD